MKFFSFLKGKKSKKDRVLEYLKEKALLGNMTAFDFLLSDYKSGELNAYCRYFGVTNIEIHLDFTNEVKCIAIAGKVGLEFIEIQIDEKEFLIGYDVDEVDCYKEFRLKDKQNFYQTLENYVDDVLKKLRKNKYYEN